MSSTPAQAKCAFRSMRCGRRRRSMRSASTTTRRSPTGATAAGSSIARLTDSALSTSTISPAILHGGEAYDWFYADDAARDAQTRTPITDGLGKPWVFRQKDIWNFWSQPHYERVGGAELASPTAWVPQAKPIWLTEIGCPAVDKGANQPSVFPDPKSSEVRPAVFFQRQARRPDPAPLSRSCARRLRSSFRRMHALNPVSAVYGGRMIAPDAIHLWTWDARPFRYSRR